MARVSARKSFTTSVKVFGLIGGLVWLAWISLYATGFFETDDIPLTVVNARSSEKVLDFTAGSSTIDTDPIGITFEPVLQKVNLATITNSNSRFLFAHELRVASTFIPYKSSARLNPRIGGFSAAVLASLHCIHANAESTRFTALWTESAADLHRASSQSTDAIFCAGSEGLSMDDIRSEFFYGKTVGDISLDSIKVRTSGAETKMLPYIESEELKCDPFYFNLLARSAASTPATISKFERLSIAEQLAFGYGMMLIACELGADCQLKHWLVQRRCAVLGECLPNLKSLAHFDLTELGMDVVQAERAFEAVRTMVQAQLPYCLSPQ